LLRDAIRFGTPLGYSASECVAAGRLVPDALVDELVHARLERSTEGGFLLDGYPRNLEQLNMLRQWLRPRRLDAAIELAMASGVEQRLAARGRADDTPAGVRERLRAFASETSPMLHDLGQQGLVISIDADQPVDKVTEDILQALAASARRTPDPDRPLPVAQAVYPGRF